MKRAVAAVATGQTDHASSRKDVGIPELVREAVDRCLEPRELTFADFDAVVLGNMEMFEGINMVEHWLADAIGVAGKPLWKLNNGGTVGSSTAVAATYLIASGFHDRVLCIGFEKQSEGSAQSSITTVGDPIWERAVMAGAIGNFAAMTSVYVNESGVTAEQAAKVAVKARRNACLNPHAQLKMPDITVEKVLESKMLAHPVPHARLLPELGRRLRRPLRGGRRRRVARVAARMGACRGDRPRPAVHGRLAEAPRRDAQPDRGAQARVRPGGDRGPVRDLDVAEIYEPATYAELAMYECLGFCEKGGGGRFIDAGTPLMDGALPVNPSGGVLSANPVGATALIRVAEAAMQVMGEAGEHQIENVRTALATGYGGNAWTDLLVLRSEKP